MILHRKNQVSVAQNIIQRLHQYRIEHRNKYRNHHQKQNLGLDLDLDLYLVVNFNRQSVKSVVRHQKKSGTESLNCTK